MDIVDFGGMGFVIGGMGALIVCVKSDTDLIMMIYMNINNKHSQRR